MLSVIMKLRQFEICPFWSPPSPFCMTVSCISQKPLQQFNEHECLTHLHNTAPLLFRVCDCLISITSSLTLNFLHHSYFATLLSPQANFRGKKKKKTQTSHLRVCGTALNFCFSNAEQHLHQLHA